MVPISKEKLTFIFLHVFFYSAIHHIDIVMQLLLSFLNNIDWFFGEEKFLLSSAWWWRWRLWSLSAFFSLGVEGILHATLRILTKFQLILVWWAIHWKVSYIIFYFISMNKSDKLSEEKITEFKATFRERDKDGDNFLDISVDTSLT